MEPHELEGEKNSSNIIFLPSHKKALYIYTVKQDFLSF